MLDDNVEWQAWGPSFLKTDSRDRGNWDRMADWLHERRQLYERALREAGSSPAGRGGA